MFVILNAYLVVSHEHHKRGSSGIPSFFQKKVPFEMGQYMDEKGRLCISYWCRLYNLRITESLFEIVSSFHGMDVCVYVHMCAINIFSDAI